MDGMGRHNKAIEDQQDEVDALMVKPLSFSFFSCGKCY